LDSDPWLWIEEGGCSNPRRVFAISSKWFILTLAERFNAMQESKREELTRELDPDHRSLIPSRKVDIIQLFKNPKNLEPDPSQNSI
jgi:hypothetical protein